MQFSLKTLLCFALVCSLAIVSIDYFIKQTHWGIVHRLREMGARKVTFHCSHCTSVSGIEFGNRILGSGLEDFEPILSLDLRSLTNPDLDLARLGKIRVGFLKLDGTGLSDLGVRHIAKLLEVGMLFVNDTRLTDACLDDIASIHGLERVELIGTNVTRSGVMKLKSECPNLTVTIRVP